ncbi:MAG: dihydroneopterin aldolase [Alphaproteobacteria bacterium]|nr:dihydroneopterin aldolase [Alphaproteobacteria bacterium]
MTQQRSQIETIDAREKGDRHSDRADCIFVRDYVIDCNIGVYAEEKGVTQKVRLSIDAALSPNVRSKHDEMEEVPSYTDILDAIDAITSKGHINLVETFAEQIAETCLRDPRIVSIFVRVEKLERGPVRGVEITRPKADHGKTSS